MNTYCLATQMPRKAKERNVNTMKSNANATKRQDDETNETLLQRFLNANATKGKRGQIQKGENGAKRKRNRNFTCAFTDLHVVSFN